MTVYYTRMVRYDSLIVNYEQDHEIQHQPVGSNSAKKNYCSFPLGVNFSGVLLYTWITESHEQAFELSELGFTSSFASFLCKCLNDALGNLGSLTRISI